MIDTVIAAVWIVYLVDLFVAAVPGAWTFRGRRGAMRASDGPDLTLSAGFALMRLPLPPWHAAFVAAGTELPEAARLDRVEAVAVAARPVAVAASTLAFVLLAGLPAVRAGWLTPYAWALTGIAAWVTTALVFLGAYRRLHRRWPAAETWFGTLLSPVAASRCVYTLQWRSLEALHPLEAAVALCDDAEVLRVARQWSYDTPDDVAAIRCLLEPRGLGARLSEPPPLDADRSPRYCPRCGGGYAAFAADCADCGVALIARVPDDLPVPEVSGVAGDQPSVAPDRSVTSGSTRDARRAGR